MKLASVDILYCKSHLNEPIEGLSNLSGFWVFFVLLDHLEKNKIFSMQALSLKLHQILYQILYQNNVK